MYVLQGVALIFQRLLSSVGQQAYSNTASCRSAVSSDLSRLTNGLTLSNGTAITNLLLAVNSTDAANLDSSTRGNRDLACNSNGAGSSCGQASVSVGRHLLQDNGIVSLMPKRRLLVSADATVKDVSAALMQSYVQCCAA